jgi:amino acid transporter
MKKIIYLSIPLFLSVIALPALAAATTFKELVENVFIANILKPLVPFIVGLAVVVFIYGVLTTMLSEGGEKKEDGKKYMLWGIIGIFVMVSVWGLVNIVSRTIGLQNNPISIQMSVPNVTVTQP